MLKLTEETIWRNTPCQVFDTKKPCLLLSKKVAFQRHLPCSKKVLIQIQKWFKFHFSDDPISAPSNQSMNSSSSSMSFKNIFRKTSRYVKFLKHPGVSSFFLKLNVISCLLLLLYEKINAFLWWMQYHVWDGWSTVSGWVGGWIGIRAWKSKRLISWKRLNGGKRRIWYTIRLLAKNTSLVDMSCILSQKGLIRVTIIASKKGG